MVTLFRRLCYFFLPLLGLLAYLEYYSRANNSLVYKIKYLNENHDSIECLIMGASHNWRSINPELLSVNTATIANAGSAINIDFLLFDRYINELPNLKAIVFPASLYSFEDVRDENWEKNHLMHFYYGINNYKGRISFNQKFLIAANFKIYVQKYLASTHKFNKYGYMYRERTILKVNEQGSLIQDEKVKLRLENHQKKGNRENYLKNTARLNEIIQQCLERNIKVVLLSPPKLAPYNNQKTISRSRREQFFEQYQNNPNVFIWNEERTFENRPELFFDLNHMNNAGANEFSPRFDSLLNTIID